MGASRLPKAERQARILAALETRPAIRVSSLAEQYGVSDETIRRDLDHLSEQGLLNRTYGGASVEPMGIEPSLNERYRLLVEQRAGIAREAASLVAPGEVLMVDAGSTTAHFAKQLAGVFSELTVITNSLAAATALAASPSIRVILCPGDYDAREGGVFGHETVAFLRRFLANSCFVGASGLDTRGPTEANSGSAWVKRTMLAQSKRHVLLIDKSKYNQPMLEVVCSLAELDEMVVDAAPAKALAGELHKAGVRLHVS